MSSWTELLGPRARFMITISAQKGPLTCAFSELPIGIEPMTYAVREARLPAPSARPALILQPGRSGCPGCTGIHSLPVHEPVHAEGTAMVTLRDPAPAGLLTPGMSTALGRRVLFLELWRLRSSSISAGWSCFSDRTRQSGHPRQAHTGQWLLTESEHHPTHDPDIRRISPIRRAGRTLRA